MGTVMSAEHGERGLLWGLLVSVVLHTLLLAMLRNSGLVPAPAEKLLPIEVDLAPAPAPQQAARPQRPAEPAPEQLAKVPEPDLRIPERQIVAPPDAGEEAPPKDTRLLSDRDNRVPEETVRRAENYRDRPRRSSALAQRPRRDEAGQASEARRSDDAKAREGERVASLPKLDQLLPSLGEVPVGVAVQPTPGGSPGTSEKGKRRLLLDTGGPTFAVQPGTADFLPGIREGNITLLNTKAERFAPFVRRVAARVFQHLDIRLRQTARAGHASAGREYAVVEAVMDRQGQLVRARVVERQSTSTFGADRVLLSVTTPETFFDANPPPGAEASDGLIHFILLIDLDIVTVPDPRTGRVAVGYRGIAGVGLDALNKEGG
ncbi:MAG: hypothetical protein KatS3mg077_2696 [Candidatus Binatia bacterium]|nr:MAG: hypothetical protein KatS3mg077_2696 [Candidatus Binatia bacterium]